MTHRMRLTSLDRLKVDGRVMALIEEGTTGYVFEAVEQLGVHISYTYAEFADLLRQSNVTLEPSFYAEGRNDSRAHAGIDIVGGLPEKTRSETVWRHAYVTAFLQLYRDGEVFRTPDSVPKALPKLESHVNDLARATQSNWKNPRAGRKNEFRDPPCAKSLLTWVKRYEDGGYSALALVPRTHRSGNRKARFCPRSRRILGTAIEAYLTRRRLNKREVFDEFRKLIDNANEQLLAANQLPLKGMSRRGVERAIGSLDPYFTYVQRHGVDAANRKFALYEKGVDASYPMERIEIDEWKVDLISIFETSGLLDFMDADQLAGLERGRRWLYLAIDCATRCVVGMRLAQSPNSDDSVALLQDITRDKTGIAHTAGCTSTWHHHGGLQAVLTDLGAAFVDDNFRTAVLDAHGNPETPPGGLPQLRSRVERIFGTFGTSLMPYLGGRTFSSPKERGDYPSVQSAALSDDVLMQILVIFVVDVYHNRPHQGLRGETPNNCWKRLSQEKGVAPALSERSRRIAFGLKDRRRVSGRGVRKFGIDYTCGALRQFHPHSLEKDVDIRVDLHDLGWIMVRIGGEWHVAHALQKCFGGVSYDHWSAVARHLRQKHHEEAVLQERTIAEALKRIIEINAREEWRFKAILHALTPAGLRRAKEDLFLGLSIEPESEIDLPPDDDLFGRSIPHDGEGASDRPAKEDPDKPTGDNSNTWEFDGDE